VIGRPGTGTRVIVGVALALLALAGCARPGQLGSPLPAPEPAAPAEPLGRAALPEPPSGSVLLSSGFLDEGVSMRSTGPAEMSVETVVLAPGESMPWHRHPGDEVSLVRSGEVTVQRAEECEPRRYGAGDGMFVDDGEPHVVRNETPAPAELVVTRLLAPGAPEEQVVEPAC
jgi:quercetin dioxygenase-like cupin family protein